MRRRIAPPAALLVACVSLAVIGAAATPARTALAEPPGSTAVPWTPDPATYGVAQVSSAAFTMSDGAQLMGDIYYPADPITGARAPGRFPVLLTMSPYGPAGQGGQNPVTHPPAFIDAWTQYFVSRGYIYVEVDARGTSRSRGDFTIMDPKQAQDFLEMVDYCGYRLDGSSGVVGLNGQSYLGLDQVFMGRLLRPGTPLRAMAPSAVGIDLFREPFHSGGMPGAFVAPYDGVELLSELYPTGKLPDTTPDHLAATSADRAPTLAYNGAIATNSYTGGDLAYEDAFWLQRRIADSVTAIVHAGVPVLMTSGAPDFFANGSFALYSAFQNAVHGRSIWAPMDHSLPASGRYQLVWDNFSDIASAGTEYLQYELEWYDTFLKGRNTGVQSTPDALHILESGDNRWVGTPNSAYPVTDRYTPMYLGSGGTLGRSTSTGSDSIAWSASASVTYTSAPFAAGATLAGPISATIYATSSTPDVELIATLNDVAPDGGVTSVHGTLEPDGVLVASQEALDSAKSWYDSAGRLIFPYHTFSRTTEHTGAAGSTQRLDIEMHARMLLLAPGHRLQLVLTTQDANASPTSSQLANLTGGTYQVEHEPQAASFVNLPLLPYGALPTVADPTGPAGLGGVVAAVASAAPAPDAAALSQQPVVEDASWSAQVLDPPGPVVTPVAVRATGSGVSNPDGLVTGHGPTTLTAGSGTPPHLLVDMGLNTGGTVEVGLNGGATTDLRLGYGETSDYLTTYGDNLDSGNVYFDLATDDKLTACTGPFGPAFRCDLVPRTTTSWTSPSIRGAERYIWVEPAGSGSVSIDYIRIRRESFAPTAADYRGHFLSSDPLLNRIWYGSAYTNDLATVNNALTGGNHVFVDAPKRDRASYTGDGARQIATAMYGGGVPPSVSRDFLEVFPCYQTPSGYILPAAGLGSVCPAASATSLLPPGTGSALAAPSPGIGLLNAYVAIYISAVADYYLFTGDVDAVRSLLPTCELGEKYLASYVSNGLINSSADTTWSLDSFSGVQTFENAYYVRALQGLATLEQAAGAGTLADGYRSKASVVLAATRAALWDGRHGAFMSGVPSSVSGHSEDGNSQAILAGIATPEQQRTIVDYLDHHMQGRFGTLTDDIGNDPTMHQFYSPFAAGMELDARLTAHDTTGALNEMRRLWGYMMATSPASTTWEKLMLNGKPESSAGKFAGGSSSMAHGWSTGPTEALSAYVGGLRPVSPGWRTWLVEPQPGDLSWAQTTAPTAFGPIASRWVRGTADSSLRLTVSAPPLTAGTIAVPLLGSSRVIAVDGRVVWDGSRAVGDAHATGDRDYVRFAATSGTHTYAWVAGPVMAAVAGAAAVAVGAPNTSASPATAGEVGLLAMFGAACAARRRRRRS